MNESGGKRGRGRPPSKAAHDKALAVARDILIAQGLNGLTIEAVARRSGTGKPTLYRYWANAPELAMAVFIHEFDPALPPNVEAAPRAALIRQLDRLMEMLSAPLGVQMVRALAMVDPHSEIATRFRDHVLTHSRSGTRALLTRFIDNGTLSAPPDLDLLVDMLHAPLFLRALAGQDTRDKSLPATLVDTAFAALCPGSPTQGHR